MNNQSLLIMYFFFFFKPQEGPSSLPPCFPAETAQINQGDLTDALIDTGRSSKEHSETGAYGGKLTLPQVHTREQKSNWLV